MARWVVSRWVASRWVAVRGRWSEGGAAGCGPGEVAEASSEYPAGENGRVEL